MKLFESRGHNIQLQLQLHDMHSCFEEVDDKFTKANVQQFFLHCQNFCYCPKNSITLHPGFLENFRTIRLHKRDDKKQCDHVFTL